MSWATLQSFVQPRSLGSELPGRTAVCRGRHRNALSHGNCRQPRLPKGVTKIATIEGFSEYKLDNGLQVLICPDVSKPTVTVNLTVFVGSRHEGYGEAGMAHLLEHMLFKGTPTHRHIPDSLKERGARYNGTTWVDRTNYYETMPASDDNLEFGLALESDRLINSKVAREDLISEMTVVRNEFERGENMPGLLLYQRLVAVAYDWHNYGKLTIGNRTDIERVPIDRLKEFYKKYYQTDNAMLIVAGKFDEAVSFLEQIDQVFRSDSQAQAQARHDLHRRAGAKTASRRYRCPPRGRLGRGRARSITIRPEPILIWPRWTS